MPKVTFKFDREKDLFNLWKTCNSSSKWHDFKKSVNSELIKICKDKKFKDVKKKIEKDSSKLYKSHLIKNSVGAVQKSWNKINDEFFKRLKKVMKKPICNKKFTGYLTTSGRSPYNPEEFWFMFSLFYSLPNQLATAGHEIMHIHFHNTYWDKVQKQIGEKKTSDLKEALTVLLNLEFSDLWFAQDNGYECHNELRNFIRKQWKKEPDFDKLINQCIEYLKD